MSKMNLTEKGRCFFADAELKSRLHSKSGTLSALSMGCFLTHSLKEGEMKLHSLF